MSVLTAVPPLLGAAPDLATHLDRHGPMPAALDQAELAASGLTGRGGAAFPVHRKLASMGPGGTVVANGSEGEAWSAKDATLLATAPHLVIDGLLLAARAVGASRTVVSVKAAHEEPVRRALAERRDARGVDVHVVAPGFLSGEASALVAGVAGRRPVPGDRVVRLTERGLRRRPTLVQNVESLAHLARIARVGGAAFRALGTEEDPGTRLLTVSVLGDGPRVIEVPGGTVLAAALRHAGVDPDALGGVLVGGFHGGWVPPAAFGGRLQATAGPGALRAGAGILAVLPAGTCGLRAAADVVRTLAASTAGQCGPCVRGLPALSHAFDGVVAGRPGALPEVLRLAGVVDGAGACHHPDGTARTAVSALTAFAADVDAHAVGHCAAVPR